MDTKKAGKPAFNRRQFSMLWAEVEALRLRNAELEQEARKNRKDRLKWSEDVQLEKQQMQGITERLKAEVEGLRGLLETCDSQEALNAKAYEELAVEFVTISRDVTETNKQLEETEDQLNDLQLLTNDSHRTLLRILDGVIGVVVE